QSQNFIETAPYLRIHLHNANCACRRRKRFNSAAFFDELPPTTLLPCSGKRQMAEEFMILVCQALAANGSADSIIKQIFDERQEGFDFTSIRHPTVKFFDQGAVWSIRRPHQGKE